MKFTFKPSPNYRSPQTTHGIMLDLTYCLASIVLFSALYYGIAFGPAYGLRVLLMTAVSLIAAIGTEAIYFKLRGYEVRKEIMRSFGWVTALILTLITRLDVSYYALFIGTVMAIIIGKLVFGGFGQNVFNPAAFGEALIMNSFSASKAAEVTADVFSGATPMAAMNSSNWMMTSSVLGTFVKQYGGFGGMMIGTYPSVIGGSCALLILICGAFLLWRKDIDWHLSVTYLITVFVLSLVVGLMKGAGINYALFNVMSGGVLFGTVFMMTDPVTTPITIPGRMIFAVGCAALTLILRWKSNLPDGVLFSILLMNMLTPAIDKLVDGNQIKNQALIRKKVLLTSAVILLAAFGVGCTLDSVGGKNTPAPSGGDSAEAAGMALEDFSANEVVCREWSNTDPEAYVYKCSAKGFEGRNEATITVNAKEGKIVKIEVTSFNDTPGVGDNAIKAEELARYEGATINSAVDATSGATFTSSSLRAMASAALKTAAGEYEDIGKPSGSAPSGGSSASGSIDAEDFSANEVTCVEFSNTNPEAYVYKCTAKGFEGVNEATVTVNAKEGKIVKIEVTSFNDTAGVGDNAVKAEELARYEGLTLDSSVDATTGASFTSSSLRAMAAAALNAAAGN